MAAETVLQTKLHAVEHELRRVALIVVPQDQRIADDDFALAQHPVGKRQFVRRLRRIDLDSGNVQNPRTIAPNRQPRALDDQFLEAKLEQRHRRPGDDQFDPGQQKKRHRGRTGTIQHAKPFHHELRIPSVPAGGEHRDFDGLPELTRQHARERVAIGLDLREDHEPDNKQSEGERRESEDDDGPDKAGQREGNRAGNAEEGVR